MLERTAPTDANAINFSWLLKLRWGVVVGQLAIVLGVDRVLGFDLPLVPLLGIIGAEAATNLAAEAWARGGGEARPWMLGGVMALDVVILTALLHFSGGPFNPFTTIYLVNIALAPVILTPRWTWSLTAFSLLCFAVLFFRWSAGDSAPAASHHLRLHLEGMWVAFGIAAGFIVYFVQRVTRALAQRDAELTAARSLTARSERLASLATLAAGAAHQLATPLSTIAVVAKELEHQLSRGGPTGEGLADVRLIREQVDRCREILVQMAADAGESAGDSILTVAAGEIADEAIRGLPSRNRVRVSLGARARGHSLAVPRRAVVQALRNVLKNAQDASPAGSDIYLDVDVVGDRWHFAVRDTGAGMPDEVRDRAGEPFFTTKPPGQGMGLGLFLARAVLESLGGRLELESAPGHGTTATLILPLEESPTGADAHRAGAAA